MPLGINGLTEYAMDQIYAVMHFKYTFQIEYYTLTNRSDAELLVE